jgi:chemotaxis protein CheX
VSGSFIEINCASLVSIPQGTIIELDFSQTKFIEKTLYPSMHRFKNQMQKNACQFVSYGFSNDLISQLQADGVINIFNIKKKEENKSKVDVNFISPFIQSTINTLSVQANTIATCKSPQIKGSQEFQVDIAGVISLVSDAFVGSISLCFPRATFLKICHNLFGEEHQHINSEIEDAAAELLNMIFGAAKAELNKKQNYQIKKALPTIISGNSLRLKQSMGPTIILPFDSDAGLFHLEIEVVDK